jgi:hypothetical protein
MPFAQSMSTGVQWNSLKDSLPPPRGYLKKYLANLKKIHPARFNAFPETIKKAITDIPEGIRLLSEFFTEAKSGFDVIEAWLTGACFLLSTALIGERILKNEKNPDIALILERTRNEYESFLRRRENPLSAAKNAGLVYDVLIEYFKN